jgi:hypothetical protein
LMSQALRQALPCQPQATAHRGLRCLQALGDLGGGTGVVIRQLYHGPLRGGEARYGVGDQVGTLLLPQQALGMVLVAPRLVRGRLWRGCRGRPLPDLVGLIPGNAQLQCNRAMQFSHYSQRVAYTPPFGKGGNSPQTASEPKTAWSWQCRGGGAVASGR